MSLEVANEGIADFLASRFLRDAVAKAEKFAYAGSIEGEFALARQAGGPSYRALARCTPVKRTSGLPLWMRAEKPISRVVRSTTMSIRHFPPPHTARPLLTADDRGGPRPLL